MVLSSWKDIEMIHRYEDMVLIKKIIIEIKPVRFIELGTFQGGFSGFVSEIVKGWGGKVYTFDKVKFDKVDRVLKTCKNIEFHQCDIIGNGAYKKIVDLISSDVVCVYCDNGHKNLEIELYAPYLKSGSIIGTHDYGTECIPERAESFLKNLNFEQLYHIEFEKFVHPIDYPHSLTRFWIKKGTN